MPRDLDEQYAVLLEQLHGNDFQLEVAARLKAGLVSFIPVPAKPQGDGGLDGISHNGTVGYCCYGIEHNAFKRDTQRVKAIVEKFADDLLRLFELSWQRKKFVPRSNAALDTILPKGQALEHVELIPNWFHSHEILGPLLTKFAEYKAASGCRFVKSTATLSVSGPRELANTYAIDERALMAIQARGFSKRVVQVAAMLPVSKDQPTFDGKIEVLREITPAERSGAVQTLTAGLREGWRLALGFEHELDQSSPIHHQVLDQAKKRIAFRVSAIMQSANNQWLEVPRAADIAREELAELRSIYGSIVDDVAPGEIARLIGECTIGWMKGPTNV
jgi:hypothetical protein